MQQNSKWVGVAAITLVMMVASANAQDSNTVTTWPVSMQTPSGTIEVYQPQSETFTGNTLTARAAVSVTPAGAPAAQPVFGAIWFSARVDTDRDAHTVTILDLQIKRVAFPTSDADQQNQLTQLVQTQLPRLNVTFSLDQLTAGLSEAQKEKIESQNLSTVPPTIIFSTQPATLVTLDGAPKLQPVLNNGTPTGVLRVVNTPFIMMLDSSKQWFLKAGDTWLVAPDVKGPWGNANSVPTNVTAAAATLVDNSAPADANSAPAPSGPVAIYVVEQPTELIVTNGNPTYTPLPGNDLLYMSNTDSDVFMDVQSQTYFVLLAGRWFTSSSLNGPWSYNAPESLPSAFGRIPADSPKANVLASVPGTLQAQDAVLDAAIPQTAAVPLNAPGPDVTYDGDPNFVPVTGTSLTYADNSPYSVINYSGGYYCCDQAIWYESPSPRGGWRVCRSVPDAIYTIPPSCPIYNCRFVRVYNYTPDVVYMGYLPGYTGCYVYGGTVVYGTGYVYPAWYHNTYIARPYTWGFSVRYDDDRGVWGYGSSERWNHRWFARPDRDEEHSSGWFGPRGYVGYHSLVDRRRDVNVSRTNIHVKNVTINRINLYQHKSNDKRGVRVTQHVVQDRTRASRGNQNVFAGKNGQVYRQTKQGWEQRGKSGWKKANPPAEVIRGGQRSNQPNRKNQAPSRQQRPVDVTHGNNRQNQNRADQRQRANEPAHAAPAIQRNNPRQQQKEQKQADRQQAKDQKGAEQHTAQQQKQQKQADRQQAKDQQKGAEQQRAEQQRGQQLQKQQQAEQQRQQNQQKRSDKQQQNQQQQAVQQQKQADRQQSKEQQQAAERQRADQQQQQTGQERQQQKAEQQRQERQQQQANQQQQAGQQQQKAEQQRQERQQQQANQQQQAEQQHQERQQQRGQQQQQSQRDQQQRDQQQGQRQQGDQQQQGGQQQNRHRQDQQQ